MCVLSTHCVCREIEEREERDPEKEREREREERDSQREREREIVYKETERQRETTCGGVYKYISTMKSFLYILIYLDRSIERERK